jgi:hypothetical protein
MRVKSFISQVWHNMNIKVLYVWMYIAVYVPMIQGNKKEDILAFAWSMNFLIM